MAKIRSKDVALKYEQILSDLKNKKYSPVYLLTGEESYYIDAITNYISSHVLSESEKSFNQLVMYGKDTDARSIVFAAARPPMMASHQVVIVKEAQNIRKFDDLEGYLKKPLATTILVICYKDKPMDKRTRVYKEIEKAGVIFETVKLYDNEIPSWITSYLQHKQCSIEPTAAGILAEYIGSDLCRIANELEKLFTLLPKGSNKITSEHIEQNIGISKEYNTFELNKAVMQKNALKAYRIINYFGQNPNANPMVVSTTALFMQFIKVLKLHVVRRNNKGLQPFQLAVAAGIEPYFVKDYEDACQKYPVTKVVKIVELLREYDMKSKGWNNVGTPEHELLRELVTKIMN